MKILRVEAIYKFTAYFFAIFGDATKGTIMIQQYNKQPHNNTQNTQPTTIHQSSPDTSQTTIIQPWYDLSAPGFTSCVLHGILTCIFIYVDGL